MTAIGVGTLKGPAGVFATASFARLTGPLFAALPTVAVEFWIRPTGVGRIFRVGPTALASTPGIDIRLEAAGWACTKRTGAGNQVSTGPGAVTLSQDYHVVVVFRDGFDNLIYINGDPIALTHGSPAKSGTILVSATDELAIGDPTPTDRNGFAGTLGRVFFWPFATSATWVKASYRAQADQVAVLGIGPENLRGTTNRGPVAIPMKATATAGSPVDVDVAVRAFDPNGNLLTASVPVPPTQGVSTIVANKVRYTPQGGSGGPVPHTVPFQVADAALNSRSIIRVQVTGAPPPTGLPLRPYMSLPEVTVSSSGNLGDNFLTAYGTSPAGRIIRLPLGNYDLPSGSTFNLNKVGLSASAPIIILPVGNNWDGVIFRKRVVLAGAHHTVAGLNMADGIAGHILKITGAFCRVSRCSIDYTGTSAACGVVIDRANDAIVDRNDIRILNGASGKGDGRGIGLEDAANAGLRPIIELNYLHDSSGRMNDPGEVNFHEAIQTGRGVISGSQNLGALVQYNLIDTWTNESEVISCKSRGGLYLGNFLRNSGNSRRMSNRLGNGNVWRACKAESGGFVIRDNDVHYIGCVCTGAATFEVSAGNISAANYNDSQTGPNIVASDGAILDWCEGRVNVGICGQSGDTNPAVNTTIRSHTGTVQSTPRGTQEDEFFWDGLNEGGTAPGTKPPIINLTPSNTGPNAA